MADKKFTGVIPPVVVPLTQARELDVLSFERSVNRMIDAGVDGLFIETHEHPEIAKSDGANMLKLDLIEALLYKLTKIREAIR